MRKIENWDDLHENTDERVSDFARVDIGQYVCKILAADDKENKEYLKVYFDIAKGDIAGVFSEQYDNFSDVPLKETLQLPEEEKLALLESDWPMTGIVYRSYKKSAERFFASFIKAVEKSNADFKFNMNKEWASQFKGKYFAGNFAEEEYVKDGELKTVIKCRETRSLQALKEGKIKDLKKKTVPDDKRPSVTPQSNAPIDIDEDEDLPF